MGGGGEGGGATITRDVMMSLRRGADITQAAVPSASPALTHPPPAKGRDGIAQGGVTSPAQVMTSPAQVMTSRPGVGGGMMSSPAGPNPQVAKGTHVLIPLGETSATGWTAEEEELGEGAEPPGGPALNICLTAPPDAPIGRYRLSIKTRTGVGEYAAPFDDANDFFLLFNPWCPGEPAPSGAKSPEFGQFGGSQIRWFRGSPG